MQGKKDQGGKKELNVDLLAGVIRKTNNRYIL